MIIPTFNRKPLLLERAIPSVLSQTYERTRAIVVDHGSTDGTLMAVTGMRNQRVIVVHCPRLASYPPTAENHWLCGPTDPLNVGLGVAKGDWIARMDDDDVLMPDHVETLLRLAVGCNYEFVSSRHLASGKSVDPYVMTDGTRIGGCQTWVYRSYLKLFRYNQDSWRKSWNRNNDTDLQDRMWRAGVRMGYHPMPTVIVDPRPGETCVGSAVYRENADRMEELYAFGSG